MKSCLRGKRCSLTPFSHLALLGENYSQQIYPVARVKARDSFSLFSALFELNKAFPQLSKPPKLPVMGGVAEKVRKPRSQAEGRAHSTASLFSEEKQQTPHLALHLDKQGLSRSPHLPLSAKSLPLFTWK